jgi:hypothetical protein
LKCKNSEYKYFNEIGCISLPSYCITGINSLPGMVAIQALFMEKLSEANTKYKNIAATAYAQNAL